MTANDYKKIFNLLMKIEDLKKQAEELRGPQREINPNLIPERFKTGHNGHKFLSFLSGERFANNHYMPSLDQDLAMMKIGEGI